MEHLLNAVSQPKVFHGNASQIRLGSKWNTWNTWNTSFSKGQNLEHLLTFYISIQMCRARCSYTGLGVLECSRQSVDL